MQALAGSMWALGSASKGPGNGLLNNLVAYWGLDEAGGANNALDKHTNGLTLTQANSPGSSTGLVYAGARTFSGSSQYFQRTSQTLLQGGDNEMTWAIWVMLSTKTGTQPIISKYDLATDAGRDYIIYYAPSPTDRFRFGVNTGAGNVDVTADNFGSPSLNTWYFVLAWHDPTNNKTFISINNGAANSADFSAGMRTGAEPLSFGSLPDISWYFTGRMGPVAMWKSTAGNGGVLSAAQRTALYNAGAGLAYSAFTN